MFTTSRRHTSSTTATAQSTIRLRPLLSLVVALILGLFAAQPQVSRAQFQSINLCTIYQQNPLTEDARSAVNDDWDENDQSWDSFARTIQTFNGDTLTEVLFQEQLSSGAWRDTARATPEYDDSDRITRCTFQTKKDGNFVNSLRTNFEYNTDGQVDLQLTEVWDSTDANPNGEWVNSQRSTFEYDNDGNNTLQLNEVWNAQNQEWQNSQRFTFEYDSNGNNTLQVNEVWNGQNWQNSQRFNRTYDSQDRITEDRQEMWDPANQEWQNSFRTQYTYTTDSIQEVDQSWDGSSWMNQQRRTTSLNDNDLPTVTETETWNGSDWVNEERSTNTYTTHQNTEKIEEVLIEDWDGGSGVWVNDERTRFSYTDIIPVELARFEAQRAGNGAVQLTWQTVSETNNSGFEVQRQTGGASSWTDVQFVKGAGTTSDPQSYRFTDRAAPYAAETVRYRLKQVDLDGSAELSKTVEVRLGTPQQLALQAPFPNPAQNEATIRYELPEATAVQIAVYDLLGRRVATLVDGRKNAGRAQISLRTQQLPSGTYILRLQAADQIRTQRLTVVK